MGDEPTTTLEEPLLVPPPTSSDASVQRQSRNIPLTLWYMFLRCAGEAIWYGSVISAYVYMIDPQNPAMVGYLSAIEGIAQFCAALIAGVIADLYRRDTLLKVACGIGMLASGLTFLSSSHESRAGVFWWCLLCAMPLWGIFDGIGLTASMALFADSIPDGKRSYYFTQRTILTTVGSFVGPLCSLLMFAVLGNTWTISACSKVICIAQLTLLPAFILLCFFRDEDTPSEQSQPPDDATSPADDNPSTLESQQEDADDATVDEPTAHEALLPGSTTEDDNISMNDEIEDEMPVTFRFGMTKHRYIAVSAASSDVVCSLASGMSFRYFAVFFLNNLALSPVTVQVLDAFSCLMGSGLLVVTQRLALWKGRCSVSIVFKVTGVVCLGCMIALSWVTSRTWPPRRWIVAVCYILQNAFLNSTQALTRSLVMDNVPSNERAKWSALESINIFGWCGSAAIGGVLVHFFGGDVLPVFCLSAVLQLMGCLPLFGLIGVENLEQ